MKNRWRTTAGLTATGLALTAGLSACSSSADAPEELKVGVFAADVTFAPFYAAIGEDGALQQELQKEGIDLQIETIPSGSNLVAALAGGSVDMAIVPGSSVLGVSAQGGELVPLMNMFNGPSQQVIARTALEKTNGDDIAAFADARWAFTRAGSISEISANLTAESGGLKWDDMTQIPLGSGSETQAVLESDRADILSTSPGNSAKAVKSGAAYLVTNPQDDESLPIANQLNSVFAASREFSESNPELAQTIVTALIEETTGLASADSPEEVLKQMPQEFRDSVGQSWDEQWNFSRSGFARATGGFSSDEVEQTLVGAQMVSVVPADWSVPEDLFDNELVVTAYKDLGTPVPDALS